MWFSPSAIKSWTPKNSGKQGRQRKYSDVAIETVLTLRLLFHLPLRQAEGFVSSLFQLMGLNLPTPDHTTLSRRARTLNIRIKRRTSNKPLHLIVDLQVYQYMVRVLGQVERSEEEVGENYILWWIERDSFTATSSQSGTLQPLHFVSLRTSFSRTYRYFERGAQKMGVGYHTFWKGLRRKYHR